MKVDPRSYERNYMQLLKYAIVEVLNFFRLLYAIRYNCVHNCEDQPSFDDTGKLLRRFAASSWNVPVSIGVTRDIPELDL